MTTINISQLTEKLEKIKKVASKELSFEIEGLRMTLRVLEPEEEQQVEEWASDALDEAKGDDDPVAVNLFFVRTRVGALSHSIVELDGLDLRGVQYVEDGLDDKSQPIYRPRHEAVRRIVETWPRMLIVRVFEKYGELVKQAASAVFQAIHVEPADIESEIERYRERISELEDMLQRQLEEADQETQAVAQAQQLVEHGQLQRDIQEEIAHSSVLAKAEEPSRHAEVQRVRKQYMPQSAPPPVRPDPVPFTEITPDPVPPVAVPEPSAQFAAPELTPEPVVAEAPVAQPVPQPLATPLAPPPGRAPRTLRQAAQTAQTLPDHSGPRTHSKIGDFNGVPVYQPSDRGGYEAGETYESRSTKIPVNGFDPGSKNPRFKGPQGQGGR